MPMYFDPETGQYFHAEQQPLKIPVPFLRREIGAGDAIKAATEAAGIESCPPCEERRRKLNQKVQFTPWST